MGGRTTTRRRSTSTAMRTRAPASSLPLRRGADGGARFGEGASPLRAAAAALRNAVAAASALLAAGADGGARAQYRKAKVRTLPQRTPLRLRTVGAHSGVVDRPHALADPGPPKRLNCGAGHGQMGVQTEVRSTSACRKRVPALPVPDSPRRIERR